jgi:hypothetical protein
MLFAAAGLSAQSANEGMVYKTLDVSGKVLVALNTNNFMVDRPSVDNDSLEPNKIDEGSKNLYIEKQLNIYSDGEYRASLNTTSGSYVQEADARNKKQVRPLNDGTLQKVLQLKPITYLMKNQRNDDRIYGLTAQEVEKVFPTLVEYIPKEDTHSLSYTELIPVLVKALQEQHDTIEYLQNNQFQMQRDFALLQEQVILLMKNLNGTEMAEVQE